MKQYCRYCSSCILGDCYYCTDKQRVLSDSEVKRPNHCDSFNLSECGDVETGKQYCPREPKQKQCEGQIRMKILTPTDIVKDYKQKRKEELKVLEEIYRPKLTADIVIIDEFELNP